MVLYIPLGIVLNEYVPRDMVLGLKSLYGGILFDQLGEPHGKKGKGEINCSKRWSKN